MRFQQRNNNLRRSPLRKIAGNPGYQYVPQEGTVRWGSVSAVESKDIRSAIHLRERTGGDREEETGREGSGLISMMSVRSML